MHRFFALPPPKFTHSISRRPLVFNAGLLRALIEANAKETLNKLIVVQAGAIVETALGQIIYRAQITRAKACLKCQKKTAGD